MTIVPKISTKPIKKKAIKFTRENKTAAKSKIILAGRKIKKKAGGLQKF